MSTKTEATQQTSRSTTLDWLKWLIVAALAVGGVFGNWYYQDQTVLVRALAMVGLAVVAVFVGLQTDEYGHHRQSDHRQSTHQNCLILVVPIAEDPAYGQRGDDQPFEPVECRAARGLLGRFGFRTHTRSPMGLGRPGGNRTPNLRFWRPLLYQLSYWP